MSRLTSPRRKIRSSKFDFSKVKLTAKQSNIFVWGWQRKARFRYAVCGRRFGKTYLGVAEIKRAYRQAIVQSVHPDNEIWYGAPTLKQAKRVFWARLKRGIPRKWMAGKPNETECSITMVTGHVIRLVGLDNYDNLRGSGLWFFLGDEWADAKPEAWTEVIRPMLSTCGGHALFIGTPKGFNHMYDGFMQGQNDNDPDYADVKSWQYTSLQGGNIPEEEIQKARRELDIRTFNQEYNASFENYSGRVYYAFLRTRNVKPCPYDPLSPIHVGMDFNVNPMSATLWQERLGNDGKVHIHQFDEIELPSSDTGEMCKEIKARYGKPGFDPEKPDVSHITIYPDPAGIARKTSAGGKTDIGILKEQGFKVVAMSVHPLVRDRTNNVNARFCNAEGTVRAWVDPKCRRSIECYEKQVYKEGTSEPDKEGGFDHLPDATGYYIYTRFAYKPAHHTQVDHSRR